MPLPQNEWRSFETIGGKPRPPRSPLRDYVWILIGAAIAGGVLAELGYLFLIFRAYGIRYHFVDFYFESSIRRSHDNVTTETLVQRVILVGAIGIGLGLLFGLYFSIKCIAQESTARKLAAERERREAGEQK